MGKNPAFLFYPGDWIRDPQLQMASFQTQGIWINILCRMWDAPERGKLSGTIPQIRKLISCSKEEFDSFLNENIELNFADILLHVTEGNKNVTISNRRMVKDENEKKSTRYRVNKHREKVRNAPCNTKVTPPSSVSVTVSSSVTKKKDTLGQIQFDRFWSAYPKKRKKGDALKAWKTLKIGNGVFEKIMSAIEYWSESEDWRKEEGKYIPYPASWLRAMGWEDELSGKDRQYRDMGDIDIPVYGEKRHD